MHSMIYRTKLLHDCGSSFRSIHFMWIISLRFEPLAYVKKMYYLDVNFYRYFIGRDDQSVNEAVMIKRIDQQLRVNRIMVDVFHRCRCNNRHLRKYMLSYLEIITTISSVMLIRAETQEALDKKKELWSTFGKKTAVSITDCAGESWAAHPICRAKAAAKHLLQPISCARNSMDLTD